MRPSLLVAGTRTACAHLRTGREMRTQRVAAYSSGSVPGGGSTTARKGDKLESVRKELSKLESERDEAISIAESCAKTCVRLTDMSKLLEELALEKVKGGDEDGAKAVLQEKASLKEITDKSNTKAQLNFALAAKLAQKIGDLHNEVLQLTRAPGAAAAGPGAGPASTAPASSPWDSPAAQWPEQGARFGSGAGTSSASSVSTSASAGGPAYSGAAYGGGAAYVPPWQRSLEDAKERVRQAEAEAATMGRAARLSAQDSIAAAQERLQQAGAASGPGEGVLQARDRLRRTAEESIAEAQERLRAQDAQILEYCRRIVARFRRGEYVNDDELEFAFRQLERRLY